LQWSARALGCALGNQVSTPLQRRNKDPAFKFRDVNFGFLGCLGLFFRFAAHCGFQIAQQGIQAVDVIQYGLLGATGLAGAACGRCAALCLAARWRCAAAARGLGLAGCFVNQRVKVIVG
jgi:hypothetical protein